MNITIKGLDMPQSCWECLLRQEGCCLILHQAVPSIVPLTKLDDCPLIEIVECKECKYWHEHEWYNTCDKHIGNGFEPYHFCSYGEMRNE